LQLEKEMIQLKINHLEIQREKDLKIDQIKMELKKTVNKVIFLMLTFPS